ncbi:hypothetical protein SOM08_19380 [Hydrogenophaga sp. SNF1]|uniref:hypothetical protein n=1 Tax=Hydrogenophaga sp. SNF1 TaxID=3098762 RepID=UPI002ACBF9B3|nr:hypothetical protein [Hydrogenophaga sp. SNF1]WQB83133.1 hypothetical protein SOM08_19380 [Hydrogenophaga sp. SNF1]
MNDGNTPRPPTREKPATREHADDDLLSDQDGADIFLGNKGLDRLFSGADNDGLFVHLKLIDAQAKALQGASSEDRGRTEPQAGQPGCSADGEAR